MRRKTEHRVLTLDGQQVAVLAVADFQRLEAARRQLGASEAQAHQLRQQLRDSQRRVARLEALLALSARSGAPERASGVCAHCAGEVDDPVGAAVPQGLAVPDDQGPGLLPALSRHPPADPIG
ncbi:hypothetical protein [Micromonospora chokoriensis]|uniref:Uncharacterized protein n=1 Tax=Micromonospora chokoriensis TaxID=356851 RepID=A0A1C4X948_9ACTN|nr:hypothetical protein [Micromonospora chokoriensis]SCF05053.1 hypothetical protein GA0070612_3328 [Micromonospora chokoriensis]